MSTIHPTSRRNNGLVSETRMSTPFNKILATPLRAIVTLLMQRECGKAVCHFRVTVLYPFASVSVMAVTPYCQWTQVRFYRELFFLPLFSRDNHILSRKIVNSACTVGPKETDYSELICPTCNMLLDLSDLSRILSEKVACMEL